jgi:hypothetical protein
MKTKLMYLAFYLVISGIGLFGVISNSVALAGYDATDPGVRPLWQTSVYLVVFALATLIGLVMLIKCMNRLLIDIKINKENK